MITRMFNFGRRGGGKWMLVLLGWVFMMAALAGCDSPNRIFDENKDIPNQIWNKDYKVEFGFNIEDTTKLYDIVLYLRHTNFYPNSNLWLMTYTTYPDGTQQEQRLELPLADERGLWHGKCTGDICNVEHLIQHRARFNQAGVYTLGFEQIMRTDDLANILAVGLRVEEAKEKPVEGE